MSMLASLALKHGYKIIEVTSPAKDKLGYYAKFGFDIETQQEALKAQYLEAGVPEAEIPKPIPVGSAMTTPDRLKNLTTASLSKRWKHVIPP